MSQSFNKSKEYDMTSKGAVLVIGTGDATGDAIAKRFAKGGLIACVTRSLEEKLHPLVAQIQAIGGKLCTKGISAKCSARPWPKAIHVAQVQIDGAIDTEFIATTLP
jgi:NAD(P)-dependent dehydrogenase (short-subunit alcohol dehydrogenase family)